MGIGVSCMCIGVPSMGIGVSSIGSMGIRVGTMPVGGNSWGSNNLKNGFADYKILIK